MPDPIKVYDATTCKWYRVVRGIFGGLKVKHIKDCEDVPGPGDIVISDVIQILPVMRDEHYLILEDYVTYHILFL